MKRMDTNKLVINFLFIIFPPKINHIKITKQVFKLIGELLIEILKAVLMLKSH
ncbi:hypothetical protein ES705_39575 [subsurface metagenome]